MLLGYKQFRTQKEDIKFSDIPQLLDKNNYINMNYSMNRITL
jgi:hypothetical protein